MTDKDLTEWWLNVGSGMVPHSGADHEEHAARIAKAAFYEGAKSQRRQFVKVAGINSLMKKALEAIAAGATGYVDNDLELAKLADKALDEVKVIERFL